MKTIICSTILIITVTSCNVDPSPTYQSATSAYSSKEMAVQVMTALQHMSSQEYIALFPTLQEFHQMMEKNSPVYGGSLSAAKQEFATTYERHLITAVKESFDRIVREGNKKGIEWSTIRFERMESSEIVKQQFAQAQVVIVFNANGKTYRLCVEKALIMNGQWKVSQFIKLV
jgi:hypothetical protein